MLCKITS